MKNLTLLLLLTVAWLAPARAQRTCDEALTLGDSALKKQEYRKAIDFYFAAEAFDPARKDSVQQKINRVFDQITRLKEDADKAARNASASLKKLQDTNEQFVRKLLENATLDMNKGDFNDACEKIKTADELKVKTMQTPVSRAYMANVDSFWLQDSYYLDSLDFEGARKSAQAALALGVIPRNEIADAHIRIANKAMENRDSLACLSNARLAVNSGGLARDSIIGMYVRLSGVAMESELPGISVSLASRAIEQGLDREGRVKLCLDLFGIEARFSRPEFTMPLVEYVIEQALAGKDRIDMYIHLSEVSMESGWPDVALKMVQLAEKSGLAEREILGKLYSRIAENAVLNLEYDYSLEVIRGAGQRHLPVEESLRRTYLEATFWYAGSGRSARAVALLDTVAALYGQSAKPVISPDTLSFVQSSLRALDASFYDTLEKRYYPEMVLVKGGSFMMGCDTLKYKDCGYDELLHEVRLGDFYMARTEVTVWQYSLFDAQNWLDWRSDFRNSGNNPVVRVSWYDAVVYANWLSERRGVKVMYKIDKDIVDPNNLSSYDRLKWTVDINSGLGGYRLPTESEWEYAARGGNKSSGSIYAGGDSLALVGWYYENSGSRTHPVGEKVANELGLYDMSGNVWEWCWDWYGDYKSEPQKNPFGAEKGDNRVNRGGSWGNGPQGCRAAYRGNFEPSGGLGILGFRLAVSLQ